MHIYFSGIGGAGLSPLAQLALDCGYQVSGSDLEESLNVKELKKRGIKVKIGQTGEEIKQTHNTKKIDWLVYSAGLKPTHPELIFAKENGVKTSKRHELLNHVIKAKNLKLIAISGTHGKTTTTSMTVWLFKELNIPVSYSIGTNITFGPSAKYEKNSKYFIYECDEFDRNFLNFYPDIAIIPSLDHDHFDIYQTQEEYFDAFSDFLDQSKITLGWQEDLQNLKQNDIASEVRQSRETLPKILTFQKNKENTTNIKLIGKHNRENAFLVRESFLTLDITQDKTKIDDILSDFPGSERRMEKLQKNVYTDYAHHPREIKSTIDLATEISDNIVIVYQPHQNSRQHYIKDLYTNTFEKAKKAYWLPTYLSREDENLKILEPEELIQTLENKEIIETSEMNTKLKKSLDKHLDNGDTIIFMGAGNIDNWARNNFAK